MTESEETTAIAEMVRYGESRFLDLRDAIKAKRSGITDLEDVCCWSDVAEYPAYLIKDNASEVCNMTAVENYGQDNVWLGYEANQEFNRLCKEAGFDMDSEEAF